MFYYVTLKSGCLTKYAGKVYGLNKEEKVLFFNCGTC